MRYIRILLLFLPTIASGQVYSDFNSIVDTTCVSQEIDFQNSSQNAKNYKWDFFHDNLDSIKSLKPVFSVDGVDLGNGVQMVYDSSNWYGFITSRNNHKLFRLDFGNSLSNRPNVIDLGNVADLLSKPNKIRIFKESNRWYGLLINDGNSRLIKLEFINGLNSPPSATNLGNFGSLNKPFGLDYYQGVNQKVAIVSNLNGHDLTIINFGNSINNKPSSSDILEIGNGIVKGPMGVGLKEVNGRWYGLVCSNQNATVFLIDFNTGILAPPKFHSILNIDKPTGLRFVAEGNTVKSYISSFADGLAFIDFGSEINSKPNTKFLENLGIIPTNYSFDLVYDGSDWTGFILNYNSAEILHIAFNEESEIMSIEKSELFQPDNFAYLQSGDFLISLTAFDEYGNFDTHLDTIVVRDATAPTTSFTTQNACIDNQNTFSASSSDDPSITAWNWNFGDGTGTAIGQNVNYQFLDTGAYEVELAIESSNGCANTSRQLVNIYHPPQADFTYPSDVICSNSPLDFANNTDFYGPDSVISYHWNFNDEASYDVADTSYTFTSGGDKTVTLSATIPGCTSETSDIISIIPGPLTSFSTVGTCVYDTYNFDNQSTGNDITGYLWDFGDGYTSTNSSPTHRYASAGIYAVSLTASNALGCNTTLQQVVPVHFVPKLNFTSDLTCSNNKATFYDQSSVVNANITEQHWQLSNDDQSYFEEADGPNPVFDLEDAGDYRMQLIAMSNYGCTDTLIRDDINVKPSPVADFVIEETCLGDSTLFTENILLPPGEALNSVEWVIEGMMYSGNRLRRKFENPGEYQVNLYTRASNFCTASISKKVSILPLPELSILLSSQCANEEVAIHTEVTSPTDPVTSYSWKLNDREVSKLSSFIYEFEKPDLYELVLDVATANDCRQALTKSFDIYPSPVSEFELFPSIGANPLNVSFKDLSQGATNVIYDFSSMNDDLSSDRNTSYTYNQLGQDWPKQFVENEYGCADTSYNEIEVVIPIYDLAISDAQLQVIDQKLKMSLTIKNNGTIIVNNPEVKISIDEKLSLAHRLETQLMPGIQQTFSIDFEVLLSNTALGYVCYDLPTEYATHTDVNPYDNSECLNTENSFNVLEPFPNPSSDYIFLPVILPSSGKCEIMMTNEKGMLVFERAYSDLKEGLNVFKVDLFTYSQGLYLINIKHELAEFTKKIVINQ